MNQNPPNNRSKLPQRKSIRLKGYDYSQAGLYFITICCKNRAHLFGEISVGAENLLPDQNVLPNQNLLPDQNVLPNQNFLPDQNVLPNQNVLPDQNFLPEMVLNEAGQIANDCWLQIPNHFPNAVLHEYIIMPNHLHGIIELDATIRLENDIEIVGAEDFLPVKIVGAENDIEIIRAEDFLPVEIVGAENDIEIIRAEDFLPLQTKRSIGSIVKGFKIGVTKWMRQNTNTHEVWQRNYYEHIIKNEQSYRTISDYIINNPLQWREDKFYTK